MSKAQHAKFEDSVLAEKTKNFAVIIVNKNEEKKFYAQKKRNKETVKRINGKLYLGCA